MKGWRWFRGGRLDAQLDAELGDHLERQIADYVQAGMAPADARRRARLAFGGVEAIKEQCRDVRRTHWLEQLIQDVRYACRFLRKHPAFTMVAVVSLALGIGANAAIFSLVDAVLLKTLPVREPQELVLLRERQIARENLSWSFAQFQQLGASETLSGLCAFRPRLDFSVAVPDGAELASGQLVSGNCFDVLGVRAWLGRTLTADDDRAADARPVAVISYGFWQRHFAGDPAAIGRPLELKGQMVTIVGVLPAGFNGLEAGRTVDVTLPLALQPTLLKGLGMLASPALTASSNVRWLRLIGRRRTSVPTEQARADLQRRWQQMSPAPQQGRLELIPGAQGLNDLRQQFSLALRLLMAAVGVLLLTACANLASLMLARARAREHEIALRLALGAGRSRIVRQLLTEAAVLSALGGLAGLAIAYWSSHAVVALLSRGRSPIVLDLALDSRLLAFTFGVSVLTTVVFGMWPALWATRADPVGRGLKTPAWHVRTSRSTMLVAAQVALSIVLLVGAGLFVRSLAKLYAFDTGFERSRVLLVGVQPAGSPGGDIARLVLGGALVPVCAGVAVGLPIALWLSRIAEGTLFGITAHDPATYATSTAVLLAVATAAASLPARAAAQADPTTSLREN